MLVEPSVVDLALAAGIVWVGVRVRRERQLRDRLAAVAAKYQEPAVIRLED